MKSVRIRSYSGPDFPTFGVNTERYSVSFRIQSERGNMQTRITPNMDTFYAVHIIVFNLPEQIIKLLAPECELDKMMIR